MNIIKRKIFNEIKDHLDKKEISLIVGPRQVGKTTIMNEIKKYLDKKGEKSIFLSLDYESDSVFFKSQEDLLRKIKLDLGKDAGFVFIDEIQRKENAGLFLKGIYDLGLPYKFIVSGSGSLELKEKINESLAGRKKDFFMNPVDFEEFVDFKTEYKYEDNLQDFFEIEKEKTFNFLKEYLNFGGYPRVILEETEKEKRNIIDQIFRSCIEKDIVYLLKSDRIDAFVLMIKILASQTGQLINYTSIAMQTGLSVPSLKKYLWYAEKVFIIRTVQPFFTNKQKEITKSPIVYFIDLGLRNFSLNMFGRVENNEQLGLIFQNFIYNKINKETEENFKSINFWRTKEGAEVDFIVRDGLSFLPIEVKFSNLLKTEITRSFRSFMNDYKPKEAKVVNLSLNTDKNIDNINIKFIPYYKELTNKNN
ncbi:MAG: ATP-binding protein [Candidatus Pacebacteria bacterium]|nr:ATP-binding protein [Candidatus Paceibacterota bacterium]MDD4738230.1 ATP-binding protein [Candidatus Paceibacterota bacterium]